MKGWLDNFGKADNANDSNVSLPEGFVGLGYNTKGRNYSPAWGGQFQKGGKLIPVSPMQQVEQAVQPTPTVPYLQTKDPAEFYKSWIQSPEYERRLKSTGYEDVPDRWNPDKLSEIERVKKQRLNYLENIQPFEYNKYKKSEADPFAIGGPTININPLDYEGSSRQSIEAHEIAHVGTPTMSYQESEIIRNSMLPMAEPKLSGVQGSKEREASKSALEDYQHSQKPEEVKADLDALRFMMYDKGIYDITKGQKFTESDFEKAKQNLGKDRVFKRLENRMGKKNFVNLMNTIAKADEEELPLAMGGMSIPGSVGFTYARTGSTPSNGKYAKKTIPSAQKGKDDIEKISINDPRYPEMYKNRQVGLSYDNAISLPDLPEVVITAPRSYTMDSLRDFTTAALYGIPENLAKLEQVPTAALAETTAMLTGKPYDFSNINPNFGQFGSNQRDLSVLAYENPQGFLQNAANIGLSAIDPGLIAGGASMLRKPLLKGAQQLGKNLITETPLRNTYKINPFAVKEPDLILTRTQRPGQTDELRRLDELEAKGGINNPNIEERFEYRQMLKFKSPVLSRPGYGRGFSSRLADVDYYAHPNIQATRGYYGPVEILKLRLPAKEAAKFNVGKNPVEGYVSYAPKREFLLPKDLLYSAESFTPNAPYGKPGSLSNFIRTTDAEQRAANTPNWLRGYPSMGSKLIDQKQNGGEMKFYQNGLDWKPKSMQNGGEELYEGMLLPEVTVTPYDEQYPFYQTLSPEQRRYINDNSPIGRATRAIATTGKKGQTAKDISNVVRDVEKFGYESTGIPGTIRFANDPVKNLTGVGKTLLDLGVLGSPVGTMFGGYNPITGEETFNQQNLEGTFNTLDALGMSSMMAAPLTKPASAALRTVGKLAQPHVTSISNVANETLDAIQAVNRAKQLERLSMADVPVIQGADKVKNVRNFGREVEELSAKMKSAKRSELGALNERLTKLREQAKEIESTSSLDFKDKLNFIDTRLKNLSNINVDDFIKKVERLGADEKTINLLKNDPDLATQYANRVDYFNDERLANELADQVELSDLEYELASSNLGKRADFNPRLIPTDSQNINPITGSPDWTVNAPLKKVGNKIYEDEWGIDKFYSYPFYKNVGDKIVDTYSNLRLSGSPVISQIPDSFEAYELMPSLFADRYNVSGMLRQASKFIDETPKGLMFPASSLSGDSYPLALNMMARELKNNPDSQLRLLGFGRSNNLGFADRMNNPKLLSSELSQIIKGLEDVSGQPLPKPYVIEGKNFSDVVLPKFAISKGSTNKIIQDYLSNTSIADRLGVKRPVYEVANNTPLNMTRGSNILKDGGPVDNNNPKDNKEIDRVSINDPRYPELYKNRQVGSYYDGAYTLPDLPEVVVTGKDERIKEGMSQGSGRFLEGALGVIGAPQVVTMDLLTGKQQTPSEAWGFQNPGGWLDSYSSFGKNASNLAMDALLDPLNALGVGVVDDAIKIGAKAARTFGKKSIPQTLSPQMIADNVAASATPNASTVTNQQLRYAELDHPQMDLLQELKQKTIDRLNTPEGRRRLQYMINKNFGKSHQAWGKPVESWGEFFLHGLKSGELSGYKKLTPEDIIEDFRKLKFVETDDPWTLLDKKNAFAHREGKWGPGSFPVMYMGQNLTPKDITHIFDHEIAHHLQRNSGKITNLDNQLSKLELKKRPDSPNLDPSEEILEDADFSTISQGRGYTFDPSLDYFLTGSGGMEKLPFAAEIRRSLLRRGKIKDYYDEITPQMLEDHYDLYNKTGGNKYKLRLYEIMEKTPKNFKILSETLNKLPTATLPIAGGAAATISALQNQQPVQKQKNGGITKDNRGYWNPDNWGKPVEIDSNDITMEGVYEPLLGISDTGDTKLMQPGKNYKFKGKKVTEFPIAQTGIDTPAQQKPAQQEVSRQDYLSKFNMYNDVLKSKNYTTPYYKDNNIDTSEGGMNCINGVCYMVSNIAGVKFDKGQTKDTYTGNATFADNAMDEGYYRSNPEKEGFGVGDIFQYARKKGNAFSRFPGEVDFRNENDLYPNHAVLIVDEFVKDGKKHFKIANNSGKDKVELQDVSESELMDRYKKGYKTFDGGITYRYDPDKVASIKKENQDKVNVLKGKNPYSGQYSKFDTSNLTFFNNKVDGLNVKNELAPDKNLQRYADVYKTVYSDLGKGSNMPIDSFNKLIMNQIGIAGQETKFGELANNSKDFVPDSILPYARRAREIYNYNFGTEDNWKKDYWEKNADNVQSEFSSYQDFVESLSSEDSDYNPYRTPRSVGVFQQKDLSERGKFYNYDLDSFEGQVKSSLALAVDNYHKLKAKYPNLSEDDIIDLTTLMHNAPGKALEPRFVNYYLKNKDVDYINKVKSFKPQTIGKKPSTTTKKNEEIKFEQISPEKSKSIIDYVTSLQESKRNGGRVGINQLDAQPVKKLNQLLNFTNNPDKDNWLDKYN